MRWNNSTSSIVAFPLLAAVVWLIFPAGAQPVPLPAGTLVHRATFSPPLTPRGGLRTKDLLWGCTFNDEQAPVLYALRERRDDSGQTADLLYWVDARQKGLITSAPSYPPAGYAFPVNGLGCDPARRKLFVLYGDQGAVDVFDLAPDGTPSYRATFDPLNLVRDATRASDAEVHNIVTTADGQRAFFSVPRSGRVYGFRTDIQGRSATPFFSGSAGALPHHVAISPDERTLAVLVQGTTQTGSSIAFYDLPASGLNVPPRGRFVGLQRISTAGSQFRMAFDAASRVLYVPTDRNNLLYVLHADTVGATTIPAATYAIADLASNLALSADRRRLALLQPRGTQTPGVVQIYDVTPETGLLDLRATWQTEAALRTNGNLAFTPDNRFLIAYASGTSSCTLFVLDAEQRGTITAPAQEITMPQAVTALALSADGGLLASALVTFVGGVIAGHSATTYHLAPEPDINRDGHVDEQDLLALIADRLGNRQRENASARSDFGLDVVPSGLDLLAFSRAWKR